MRKFEKEEIWMAARGHQICASYWAMLLRHRAVWLSGRGLACCALRGETWNTQKTRKVTFRVEAPHPSTGIDISLSFCAYSEFQTNQKVSWIVFMLACTLFMFVWHFLHAISSHSLPSLYPSTSGFHLFCSAPGRREFLRFALSTLLNFAAGCIVLEGESRSEWEGEPIRDVEQQQQQQQQHQLHLSDFNRPNRLCCIDLAKPPPQRHFQ